MSTKFDMSWDDINTDGGSKVDYLSLKDGDNRVRVVSNPSELVVHWERNNEGKAKRVICTGNADCILCEHGSKTQTRYQLLVIDKSNWDAKTKEYHGGVKVKVLEVGKSVIKQIKLLAQDVEYGNPSHYDIRITKTGSGKDTSYNVTPSPNKIPLTDEETEAIKNAPKIADVNKIASREDIIGMGLTILSDVDEEFEGASAKGGSEDSADDENWDNF